MPDGLFALPPKRSVRLRQNEERAGVLVRVELGLLGCVQWMQRQRHL